MDEWVMVPEFPTYSVSNSGSVRNNRTRREVRVLVNQMGVAYVGLFHQGRQYARSVARLVAEAFLVPPFETFDTPINLNGDRKDNRVANLMWRPRWFAVKYNRQFDDQWDTSAVVEIVETGERFDSILDAATKYGLLALEIFTSAMNYTYYQEGDTGVWPTGLHFRVVQLHTKSRRNRRL